jgi:hypothetical protein
MKNMIHRPDTVASAPSGLLVAVDTMEAIQAPSPANSVVDTTLPPKMAQKVRWKLTLTGRYLE